MSNNRDRASRKRGSNDDISSFDERDGEPSYFQRQPAPMHRPTADITTAVDVEVMWFNTVKGFGFVKAADGSEAFLHVSALEAAGHATVSEGMHLKVTLETGSKGKQVSQVFDVTGGGVPTSSPRRAESDVTPRRDAGRSLPSVAPEQEREGTVEFYNAVKGLGFIGIGEEKDVFVHVSTLTRSGLDALQEGQRVFVNYWQGPKGPEARSIRLA